MKRSQSSKHRSIRQSAESTPIIHSGDGYLTSASSSMANADWAAFSFPTGKTVSKHSINKVMNMASLREADLNTLKKSDPFMYHSIAQAKAKHKSSRPTLLLTRPKPMEGGYDQLRFNEVRRNTSDSVLLVKRSSRISFEKYHDLDEILEEMRELKVASA